MNYRRRVACLLTLLALLATAPGAMAAGTAEVVGPMTIVMPSGWTRRAADPVSFFLVETSASGQEESHVYLNAVQQPGATQDAVHSALWGEMLRRESRPKRQSNGSLGRFTWSQMEILNARGQTIEYHRFYTTKAETSHIAVLFVTNSGTMFNKQRPVVEAALARARFRGTPETAAPSAPPGSGAAGVSSLPAKDIPIVESHVHVDIRSATLTSNVLTDHILFFQNGIVVREGFITAPRSCYVTIQAADLGTLPFNYGRWQENKSAREVSIRWQEGPPWTLTARRRRAQPGRQEAAQIQTARWPQARRHVRASILAGNEHRTGPAPRRAFRGRWSAGRNDLPGARRTPDSERIGHLRSSQVDADPALLVGQCDPASDLGAQRGGLQRVGKFSLRSAYDFVKTR